MRMRQHEPVHVAIGVNLNVLSNVKSLHSQDCDRVAHVMQRKNYIGPLIAFGIHIPHSHSDYEQVKC